MNEMHPIADAGGSETIEDRLPAAVRFNHRIKPRDVREQVEPGVADRIGAGEAQGRLAVVPERVTIAFAFHHGQVSALACPFELPEPVGCDLVSIAPLEASVGAVALLESQTEADRQ